jgi:hypothetical protein
MAKRKQPAAPPARKAKTTAAQKPAKAAAVKRGRPSLYRPEYCGRVIELGRQGKSKAQMASEIDVARSTLDKWMGEHEEFAAAYARALDFSLAYWESLGEKGMHLGHRFNDRAWWSMLRCRFPKEYQDAKQIEVGGFVGADAIKISILAEEVGV